MQVAETRDRVGLRALLMRAPGANGYLIGDLDSPFFERCRWFVATENDLVLSTVLIYEGLQEPCLLSAGAPDGVAEIFRQAACHFPLKGSAKVPGAHRTGWEAEVLLSRIGYHWMMALDPTLFLPNAADVTVQTLGDDDMSAIATLLVFYPENFFEPPQLRNGCYVGCFFAGRLVSLAGTHVLSREQGFAVVANVVTAPEYRRRGFARACVSRLIERLRDEGIEHVSLQVDSGNAPAIACYRQLGFVFASDLLQAHYSVRDRGGTINDADGARACDPGE